MIPLSRPAATLAMALLLAGCRPGEDRRPGTSGTPGAAAPADTNTAALDEPFALGDTGMARRTRRLDQVWRRKQTMPRFEAYPARNVFRGTPASVDLSSAEGAREFRTMLRQGAAAGPNFAGHYTVVVWGCGSPCQSFAIVDARTGRVTWGPESLTVRAGYRLDSELLIADPLEHWMDAYGSHAVDAIGGYAASTYYRWDGRRLVPLDSLPIGMDRQW
jgi:hypothetical protein